MFDDNQKGLLRFLIYPVQFDENSTDAVDRGLKMTFESSKNISPGEYLGAIEGGLQSDERLSDLIPQKNLSRTFGHISLNANGGYRMHEAVWSK